MSFFLVLVLGVLVLLFSDGAENIYKKRTILLFPMPYQRVILVYSLAVIVLTIISTIGLANAVFERIFQKEEVGAFYEAEFYERDYEALLSFEKRSIFCIVHIQRETEFYDAKRYSVHNLVNPIQLPYGLERYADSGHFNDGEASFDISISGVEGCSITLIRPATAQSYEKLRKEVVSLSGEFCASKKSNKYHYPKCPNAKRIYEGNLIYFQSKQEARVFGYVMCDYCRMNYSY